MFGSSRKSSIASARQVDSRRQRRKLSLQSLESRMVLSGMGLGSDAPIARYFLADTQTDETIIEIAPGATVPAELLEGRQVTVYAIANEASSAGDTIASARLRLNDGPARVESSAPYSLGGDMNGDFFNGQTFAPGEYNLQVEFFNRRNLRGNLIEAVDLAFTVSDLPAVQDIERTIWRRSGQDSLTLFANNFIAEPTSETYYFQSVGEVQNGVISIGGSGSALFYTANPGFVGTETVTVSIWDQEDPTDVVTAQLTIVVTDLPRMQSIVRTVDDQAGSFALFLDANHFTVSTEWAPVYFFETPTSNLGTFTVAGSGAVLFFTPVPGQTGSETVKVKIWGQTNVDDVLTVELTLNVI